MYAVPPAYYAHLAAYRARFYMEPETPPENGKMQHIRPLPPLKDKVKDLMLDRKSVV